MKHSYDISGMTCSGCQSKVQTLLSRIPGVQQVEIDLNKGMASITMDKHVPTHELQSALKDHPKYQLTEGDHIQDIHQLPAEEEQERSWLQTYKPILLIFGYILVVTILLEAILPGSSVMRWMSHFMAGFFLVFSFFKFLDLNGFAESYSTYDIVAKKWFAWGYVYAFIELGLGLFFLTGWYPLATNALTFIVMTISIIGVLQSVLNKRKIRCACLGAVFNLPMSTVTIIEDALMIGMSATMLLLL